MKLRWQRAVSFRDSRHEPTWGVPSSGTLTLDSAREFPTRIFHRFDGRHINWNRHAPAVGNQITADIPATVVNGVNRPYSGKATQPAFRPPWRFTILGPQPTIASVTPGSVSAGNAGNPLDVAVTGTNFDCSVPQAPRAHGGHKTSFQRIDHDFKRILLATRVPRLSPSIWRNFTSGNISMFSLRHRQAVGSRYPALASQ